MISEAYVFIEGLETDPVICGVVHYDAVNQLGRFRYGKSYLARPDAFALDPIHLPLTENIYETRVNKGIFGVLSDAGADAWGRKLILQLRKTKPKNELEFIIAGASMGVGALSFSLSRSKAKSQVNRNSLNNLNLLVEGKNKILASEAVSVEVKKAFQYGDSMGGARPKTVVTHENQMHLVKFNRSDDLFNICRAELAAMQLLAQLDDVNVAKTRLISGVEDLLLVQRFDRSGTDVSHHLISANSLLLEGHVSEAALKTWYSYGALAEFLRRNSTRAKDAEELYKRMVFNAFIGNTDDHGRNHALIWHLRDHSDEKGWQLSPAYDVLPVNNSRLHAIGLGDEGRLASHNNLVSQSKRFGLSTLKARAIVSDIHDLVSGWEEHFSRAGVSDGDIERLKGVIPNLAP